MQLRCKRKINEEIYRIFARDSQMIHNKRHFVIRLFAINVFYCTLYQFTCMAVSSEVNGINQIRSFQTHVYYLI